LLWGVPQQEFDGIFLAVLHSKGQCSAVVSVSHLDQRSLLQQKSHHLDLCRDRKNKADEIPILGLHIDEKRAPVHEDSPA